MAQGLRIELTTKTIDLIQKTPIIQPLPPCFTVYRVTESFYP